MNTRWLTWTFTLSCAAALTACGGGGDGGDSTPNPPAVSSAEGIYGGSLSGSASSNAFRMLVLENGDIWSMYGTLTSSSFLIKGFTQGPSTASNGTLSSTSIRDFSLPQSVSGSASASFNSGAGTISGTVSAGGQTVSFSGGPIPGSLYNYNTAAQISSVVGAWSLQSLTGETIALTVNSSGSFTAAGSTGCNFSGTLTPRPSGKNVFNVSLTFGPPPCVLARLSASGIALAYPLGSGQTQLLFAGTDATRALGTAAVGVR